MTPVSSRSDQQILRQIREDGQAGFAYLYQHCYPAVERYVIQNNGSSDKARDVFQDTLLIVLSNIREPDFQLTSSLKTYVFSISKHLWLKQLANELRLPATSLDELLETDRLLPEPVAEPSIRATIGAILARITARCVALLTALFFQNKPLETIIRDEGYANRHSAQNQKYKCLEQARKQGRTLLNTPAEEDSFL